MNAATAEAIDSAFRGSTVANALSTSTAEHVIVSGRSLNLEHLLRILGGRHYVLRQKNFSLFYFVTDHSRR